MCGDRLSTAGEGEGLRSRPRLDAASLTVLAAGARGSASTCPLPAAGWPAGSSGSARVAASWPWLAGPSVPGSGG
eukprot:2795652-Heterocapsa_arctica.AAC.1